MEWISLKVCPGSHFDGQGDVSHLPTRLAETEAPVLPLCPLRAHSIPIGSRQIQCVPRSLLQTSHLWLTDQRNKPAHPPRIRRKKPTCCVKRQVVADLFFSTFSPVHDVVLQSQRPSPFCLVLVDWYEKELEQSKQLAKS